MIVDANGWWTQADAVARWPRRSTTSTCSSSSRARRLEECAQIRRALAAAAHPGREPVRARRHRPSARAGAVDALRLKLTRFGGITPIRTRARPRRRLFGLPLTIEDSGGGDIVTAAIGHARGSRSRRAAAERLPRRARWSAERIARRDAARARTGRARLPDGPGLGIEVDEAALGGAARSTSPERHVRIAQVSARSANLLGRDCTADCPPLRRPPPRSGAAPATTSSSTASGSAASDGARFDVTDPATGGRSAPSRARRARTRARAIDAAAAAFPAWAARPAKERSRDHAPLVRPDRRARRRPRRRS